MEINPNKDRVQQTALKIIENDKHHRAKLFLATGTGKTRIPLLYIQKYDLTDICLIVPTTELRDLDWPDEFKKWGCEKYLEHTTRVCMRSCHKIKGRVFRLLIVDEAHNITPNFFEFLSQNTIGAVIILTATKPKRGLKARYLESLKIESEYIVTLPQARNMGLVAQYRINVIWTDLDNINRNIKVEDKKGKINYFTEKERYDFLNKRYQLILDGIVGGSIKFATNSRMHFIYNLPSKVQATKIISNILPPNEKVLIFVGNSEVANAVCPNTYYTKMGSSLKRKVLKKFSLGEITRMSCIKSLNEGKNIPLIDSGIINQMTSEEKDLVQRLGRFLRVRDGHFGNLYIIAARHTQDAVWVRDALENIPKEDIKYYTLQEFI